MQYGLCCVITYPLSSFTIKTHMYGSSHLFSFVINSRDGLELHGRRYVTRELLCRLIANSSPVLTSRHDFSSLLSHTGLPFHLLPLFFLSLPFGLLSRAENQVLDEEEALVIFVAAVKKIVIKRRKEFER